MAARDKRRQPLTKVAAVVGPATPNALKRYLNDDESHNHPVFSFCLIDRSDSNPWGWGMLDEKAAKRLLEFLISVAGSTWQEIGQQTVGGHFKHHYQPLTSLCSAARRRLRELQLDEFDSQIFRF